MSETIKFEPPRDRVFPFQVRGDVVQFDPDLDEVPGLTDEDREDIRDARLAMLEDGFVTLEELEAELRG